MSDELPRGPRGPRMSHDFEQRMRRGLSTMAVRERVRERRRNRAIAGGAVAAAVVAVAAVIGGQALASLAPERDMAAPPAPTTTAPPEETAAPTTPEPTETAPAAPTPPPGFEGVAAGEPLRLDAVLCGVDGCGDAGGAGDAGAATSPPRDVYVVCGTRGSISFGGIPWIDCSTMPEGSGTAVLGLIDQIDDGDPEFVTSPDFDGSLSVVEAGAPPVGSSLASSATVFVTCTITSPPVTVGGVRFECGDEPGVASEELGAWGVPILPGEIAPRIESEGYGSVSVRFVLER